MKQKKDVLIYKENFTNIYVFIDISQLTMELEVNKRHSANVEKELQETHIQLRNSQEVMFRLKEKSKIRNQEENSFVPDHNLEHENQMLKNEISTLLKKYV